ncbi:Protein TIC 40 [Hibiscus syriacus]|uniref:Protein TIC 40, chloroplastic n=1 Tax=Hibiscus syriacus TaxID=106335 RepID=A0A6A2Z2Z5_HIBSY|nr:Protein TIC 40 [Hibiscus syriacus]
MSPFVPQTDIRTYKRRLKFTTLIPTLPPHCQESEPGSDSLEGEEGDQNEIEKSAVMQVVEVIIWTKKNPLVSGSIDSRRPDIAFSVSIVSQYMNDPREEHLEAVSRILRYLKMTLGHGLIFRKHEDRTIKIFSNSSWPGELTDRRSSWVVVSGRVSDKTHFEVQSDSESAISIVKNPVQHDGTKHVEIDRHFIAEKALPRINFDEITSKLAFVDVSPEETVNKSAFEDAELSSSSGVGSPKDVSDNGVASKQDAGAFRGFQESGRSGPTLSVDALEKMLEDPTVQKMCDGQMGVEKGCYKILNTVNNCKTCCKHSSDPSAFDYFYGIKSVSSKSSYANIVSEILFRNNMGGNTEWDNTMMESLKNFDLNSPEVKQQFDQIGLTPEEVISKIMANPEVAMAFQNPRVQAAIMECSQNPLSIAKYQNDKEVMDVFNKISELFPGMSGSY